MLAGLMTWFSHRRLRMAVAASHGPVPPMEQPKSDSKARLEASIRRCEVSHETARITCETVSAEIKMVSEEMAHANDLAMATLQCTCWDDDDD